MKQKNYICIVCPIGCEITITEDERGNLTSSGQQCKRGEAFAKAEHTRPMRMLTTTIVVEEGILARLPVISSKEIDKKMFADCLKELYQIKVKAPISCGGVIISNICDTGADILASRSMKKKENQ